MIFSILLTIIPVSLFEKMNFFLNIAEEYRVVLLRCLLFVTIFILISCIYGLYILAQNHVDINGHNYCVRAQYGDILKQNGCKKVIPFDECFTTHVGDLPSDIKPTSICGQYLSRHPIYDMKDLIDKIGLNPVKSKSKYQNRERYESGRLVPQDDYLLLAFTKLDKDGRSLMSYDDYIDSLSVLWKEIDKYCGQSNVCIPILGSGITRIGGEQFTQQELLDIIIGTYKLNRSKLKQPYKLYIMCKRSGDFSLNKIGQYV